MSARSLLGASGRRRPPRACALRRVPLLRPEGRRPEGESRPRGPRSVPGPVASRRRRLLRGCEPRPRRAAVGAPRPRAGGAFLPPPPPRRCDLGQVAAAPPVTGRALPWPPPGGRRWGHTAAPAGVPAAPRPRRPGAAPSGTAVAVFVGVVGQHVGGGGPRWGTRWGPERVAAGAAALVRGWLASGSRNCRTAPYLGGLELGALPRTGGYQHRLF